MVEISHSIRLLFETTLEDDGDRYIVSIPKDLIENGSLSVNESYRVALQSTTDSSSGTESASESTHEATATDTSRSEESDTISRSSNSRAQEPPVEEGEVRPVTIDTLGDQGDGIAKVERGFIVIVSGTQPGDQVDVKITDVKETVAFAEPVSEATVR